ncbi:MAG: hypothetical protein NTU41_11520 [Chloroflexi bacterium]|nr:hypothetical protein [Chloroflexota bacterium]
MISARFRRVPGLRRRHRRYPIVRDELGRSGRRRSFALFDDGIKPGEAALRVNINKRTARRYYCQRKKLPQDLATAYEVARGIRQIAAEFPEMLVDSLAQARRVLRDLLTPRGTRRILKTI